MNSGGQIRPPFFGAMPNNMALQPGSSAPPSPFHPNIPPPNFSVPPPNVPLGANFPRFSGPMHNQPTYNPSALGSSCNMNIPPPRPVMNPPLTSLNNHNNRGPNFNNGLMGQIPNNTNNNFNSNNSINKSQHAFANNQPRQMPCGTDNIFNDGPKEIPCGFPHFKPAMPPPPIPQNSGSPSQFSPMPPQRGGFAGRGIGFQSNRNNNFQHNKNNSYNNNNRTDSGHNNSNNNNNRGRGGFHGGRGNFHNQKGRGGNNNFGQQNGGPKAKQPKIDKRELPENNVFYCDTCDRGFKDQGKYKEHVDQHQKCTYKDCPFVAAPKLVQLHMNMQHRAGLATRIYGVKSEEDIQKWKEERRKNYPTANNVRKKKEKQQERIDRGEVIETKEFGKMRGQKGGRGRERGRGRGRSDRGRGGGRYSKGVIEVDDDDGPPEERKIERSNKEDVDLTNGTDSDDHESSSQPQAKSKKVVDLTKSPTKGEESKGKKDSSLSLVSGYVSSSSDSDDSSDEGTSGKNVSAQTKPLKKAQHTVLDSDSDDGNRFGLISGAKTGTVKDTSENVGSKDTEHVDSQATNGTNDISCSGSVETAVNGGDAGMSTVNSDSLEGKAGVKRGHNAKKGGPPDKRPKFTPKPPPKSYTLLEKLLAKEIRQERNKILQCVHFIVKNKFFDSVSD